MAIGALIVRSISRNWLGLLTDAAGDFWPFKNFQDRYQQAKHPNLTILIDLVASSTPFFNNMDCA